ncbi:MAG: ABC transporter permease [Dermatophilaceae bacterium]
MRRVRWARAGLVIPAWVAVAFLVVPLVALLAKVDWAGLPAHLSNPIVIPALRLSLQTTSSSLVICMLLGTPLAWLLARSTHRATPWLRALVTVPLVLPPVVGGVALLMAYGREGVIGKVLSDVTGWSIPFTTVAVVFAEVFVALPFYVLAVEGSMRGLDPRFDGLAATLGASPWRTFRTVVVPMVAPGIASGAALAWARALGEFGATITFAGSFSGRTQTAPLAVYFLLEGGDIQAVIALSTVMLLISVVILGFLRGQWLR